MAHSNHLSCVLFEDEHLLVINKPAGLNTHSPSPFAGEGIYEWLKNREPRWASLAILHRLDKETSGLMVFGKTPKANKSLTQQFADRNISKTYLLLTDRPVSFQHRIVKSSLSRAGERYVSRPVHAGGDLAETHFRVLKNTDTGTLIEAKPITGRTHQIRVHAADVGFPILGDTLYGGSKFQRVCLHASTLTFRHPEQGEEKNFTSAVDFASDARVQLRESVIAPEETNAFRLVHGATDGWPAWYVEKVGDVLLSQSERDLSDAQKRYLHELMEKFRSVSAYHKTLTRHVRGASREETSPQLIFGQPAPDQFTIRENGVQYEMRFSEGYSIGLFFDQRENRRRLLNGHVAADFSIGTGGSSALAGKTVLNTFAYTCGFSVCAAKAGAQVTSLDLSKKYLEWGKQNFALNQLGLENHDFIYGDVFDWMKRLTKKQRSFDILLLDPPTFSQSKESGVFRADKDYQKLVALALPLLKANGVLFASTNAATLAPEKFVDAVKGAVISSRRKILRDHYVPQPIDFPISRDEPGYLKTLWLQLA